MTFFMDYALDASRRMRARRFEFFERWVGDPGRPLRILDLGGTAEFWERAGWAGTDRAEITCLNLFEGTSDHANVTPVAGDATDLSQYEDDAFDLTFSNSVIEHLFTFEKQAAMAREMMRVGRVYWCQTPNFWFPIEPHFHFPGWQWLPRGVRVAILRRRRCGFRPKTPDLAAARESVDEVRLLSRRTLARLFPGGDFYAERFAGLVKSWTVYGGVPVSAGVPSETAARSP